MKYLKNFEIVNEGIKKSKTTINKVDNSKYFMRIEYIVDTRLFNEPDEVLKATLHFAPKDIINKYEISYIGNEGKKSKWLVKVYSNKNKIEMQKYLDTHVIRGEEYKVL